MPEPDFPLSQSVSARPGIARQLSRRKSITAMVEDTEAARSGTLRRTFGVFQLTMISVGATLGTGILVILGEAVPIAGPAVWLAFILAGITALLSAVSYAEMAGMVPVSGSSYSYSYATLGEGVAWVCGWCLVLEYAVSVAAVAVGAADYVNETLRVFGLTLPPALSTGPGIPDSPGGAINLSALLVVGLATVLLMRGARESGDGMVPRVFGVVSTRTGTPLKGTLIVGGLVAITAALIPLGELANATSIGTLFAFCLVNIAVIRLRVTRPDLPRSFRVPFGPVIPGLGAVACAFLMVNLGGTTWIVFGLWMLVGAAVYFGYSRRNSRVGALTEADYRASLTP